jgi:hypothetical protein
MALTFQKSGSMLAPAIALPPAINARLGKEVFIDALMAPQILELRDGVNAKQYTHPDEKRLAVLLSHWANQSSGRAFGRSLGN